MLQSLARISQFAELSPQPQQFAAFVEYSNIHAIHTSHVHTSQYISTPPAKILLNHFNLETNKSLSAS